MVFTASLYWNFCRVSTFFQKPPFLGQAHQNFYAPYFSWICTQNSIFWHPQTFSNSFMVPTRNLTPFLDTGSRTICRQHEILLCITKVVSEKLWKTCVQQKRIDSFSLFKRTNASMRFSDLPLSLINNTRYEFLWLCFKTVVDHKKCWRERAISWEKLWTTYGLVCL